MSINYHKNLESALKSDEPITWLSLYRSDFSQGLPKELFQLKDLEYLSLEGTNLIHIPSKLNQLEKLKTLNLSWNKGLIFDKDLHLPNIESIILSHCELEEIPAFVFQTKQLKQLNLRRNYIRKVPQELAKLQNLSYLDLSFCEIEEVPEFVFDLQWLDELGLSTNRIKQLPEQLGKLVLLNRLYLHKNKLEHLPDSLGKLIKLEFLQLEENQLEALPESIGGCANLTELRASKNKIATVPNSITQCKKLTKLDLGSNMIAELPENLGDLSELRDLYVGGNQLTSLPESIGNIKNIDHIGMSSNQITELPKSFSKLVNIRSCYFRGNKFEKFPYEVLHWTKIINLIDFDKFPANRFTRRSGYRDFYKTMKVAKNPDPNAKIAAYHFFTSITPAEPFELKACIESLKVSDKTIQENAIKHIREHHLENYTKSPLKKGVEVVLWGAVPYKRKELKEKLAEYDIKLATKVKKTTSHAIIGRKLNKYEGYDQEGLAVLTEQELLAFFEQKEEAYLKDDSADNNNAKQNVREMLLSKDKSTIKLALQLAKTGGAPKDLITPLFLIYKNTKLDKALRKDAENLLNLHASVDLKKKFKDRAVIFNGSAKSEIISRNIRKYTSGTELEPKLVGEYISDWNGNGFRYWFDLLTEEELEKVVRERLQNSGFWLSRRHFPWKYHSKLYDFTEATHVSLRGCALRKFPMELLKFKNLEILDISENGLRSLPEEITTLDKLHALHISQTSLPAFPKFLDKMPNLKTISCYKAKFLKSKEKGPDPKLYKVGKWGTVTRI